MSDCSANAWRVPKLSDQVWNTPSGREVHVQCGDECHEVELAFEDGTSRFLHYAGGVPIAVRVDGAEYGRTV